MSKELKPCPFCGAMPETDGKLVQCYLMPCDFRRFKMPVEAWNIRPIEDDLRKRIAELEEAQRWIPVSERLPEGGETAFVIIYDGYENVSEVARLTYLGDGNWWSWESERYVVTYWTPLPEPPNDTQTQTIVYGKESER